MSLSPRRAELLLALGHRPLRLAARGLRADPAEAMVQPMPAAPSPALQAAIARAGRLAPAQVPAWLADAGIDPSQAQGKRALWPLLRAARRRA